MKHPDKDLKYVAGVSGGPDSMCLLDFFRLEGYALTVAHVNYHFRATADRDEKIVKDYCAKYEIPCFVHNADQPEGNLEAWARKERYAFYHQVIEEAGAAGILLGHNEDDLIETYLMQEEKGAYYSYYGLRESGMVMQRAPPPPRGSSDPWMVTQQRT